MLSSEIKSKLEDLEKEYKCLETEYNTLDERIELLKEEQDDISYTMEGIKITTTVLKKRLAAAEFNEANKDNLDPFMKDFITASNFCSLDNERIELGCICIKEDALLATDAYKAIIIKNNAIPEELKNNLIPWDIRHNLKGNCLKSSHSYINLDGIFKTAEKSVYEFSKVTKEDFKNQLKVTEYEDKDRKIPIYKLEVNETNIYINREFLDTALNSMGDDIFTVYSDGPLLPILLKNDRIRTVVLPVRVEE